MSIFSRKKDEDEDYDYKKPVYVNKDEIKELITVDFLQTKNPGIFVKNMMKSYPVETVYEVIQSIFYNGNIEDFTSALDFSMFVVNFTDYIPSRAGVPLKKMIEEKDLVNQYFKYALDGNKYTYLATVLPYLKTDRDQLEKYIERFMTENPSLLITLFLQYTNENDTRFCYELYNRINLKTPEATFFIKLAVAQNSCFDEFEKLDLMNELLPQCPDFFKERYLSDLCIQKKLTEGQDTAELFNFSSCDISIVICEFIGSFDEEKMIERMKEALEQEKEFPYIN